VSEVVKPIAEFDYDLFVIGAGSGGVRLARMSAATGARVAVAEERYLGGTCVNVGCVPKKLFVYASHVAEELEDGGGFGWSNKGDLSFDWPTLITNKNAEIERLNGIYQSLLTSSGAHIIDGHAKITGPHTVQVADKTYTANRIVVATGSWPNNPSFPGAEFVATSNEFFFLDQLPTKAIVLGGGYIAIELAGIMAGLGVDTTLVYRGDLLLRGFDDGVRHFVMQEVQKKGVKLKLGDNIASIEKAESGFHVAFDSGDNAETDLVLSAIGRKALTHGLGLEKQGVALRANGSIIVDQHYQTNVPSIYAIGDVIGGLQLTPVALAEGMYLSRFFFNPQALVPVDYSNIPTAVFCQPNIGTVGLTEAQAQREFGDIQVYESSFKPMKHTLSGRDERSLMKLIVDAATDKIVGVHMVGPDAGEILQGLAIAIKAGATKRVFDQTIGIHPTAAEEFVTMRVPRD